MRGPNDPTGPVARALVVDDDPGVTDFLSRLLSDLNIAVQTAEDGEEAERWLKAGTFDLLFLDLDLPRISGEHLLQSMQQRFLMRPESVVVMSAAANLASTSLKSWSDLGVANLLPKPFVAGDVRAIVRRLLAVMGLSRGQPAVRVMVAGVGLWAQALARVVARSGGDLTEIVVRREILPAAKTLRPAVIVLGSSQLGDQLEEVVRALHLEPTLASSSLVVVVTRPGAQRPSALLEAGATAVLTLPGDLPHLATTVTRLAGLSRRVHPRAVLNSAVRLSRSEVVLVGAAVDCSEGGLGVKGVASRPYLDHMHAEFTLPDTPEPLFALSEVVWTRPSADSTHELGVRFLALDERFRERLRSFVRAQA